MSAAVLVGALAVGAGASAAIAAPAVDAPQSAKQSSKGELRGTVMLKGGAKFFTASAALYVKADPDVYQGGWKFIEVDGYGNQGMGGTAARAGLSPAPAQGDAKPVSSWNYAFKGLSAREYRVEFFAVEKVKKNEYVQYFGSWRDGATVLSGKTIAVKAGKSVKDIDVKLTAATKRLDLDIAIVGDPVVGETLTADVGGTKGGDVFYTWRDIDANEVVGYSKSLEVTDDLVGHQVYVFAYVYRLGYVVDAVSSGTVGPVVHPAR